MLMRWQVIGGMVIVAFLTGPAMVARLSTRVAAQDAATDGGLRKLLDERVATARQGEEFAGHQYQQGMGTDADVDHWEQMLAEAELQAAQTQGQRVAVLQDEVKRASEREVSMETKSKSGLVGQLAVLAATDFRLQMEIELAREKGGGTP